MAFFAKILATITLLTIVGLFGWYRFFYSQKVISPVASEQPPNPIAQIFFHKKDPDELKSKVKQTIGNNWKNYSVLVSDYNSNFVMGINDTEIFTAVSVNKLPILAAVYDLAQQGKVDLDKTITLQQEDIQDYGSGTIRYDPPGTTYSVKTLARLMMQKSDNTAAYLLANYVTSVDAIQTLINSWGLTQTDIINNKTSNKDIAILMRKIFTGGVAGPALTQEMLAFFKEGDFEDRIPALLPKSVVVYHKTGNGDGSLHDVGIVVEGKTTYYIGIFTSDVTDEEQTIKIMAQLSKIVYNYMK